MTTVVGSDSPRSTGEQLSARDRRLHQPFNPRFSPAYELPYSMKGVVDAYLNPQAQPGCGLNHADDCLCDVKIESPCPLVRAPECMTNVETVEDLIQVAANLWAQEDVSTPEAHRRVLDDWIEGVSDDMLREIARLVREGLTRAQIEAQLGIAVHENVIRTIRRAATMPKFQNKLAPSTEIIIELGDAGMTAPEIARELVSRMGSSAPPTSIRRLYNKRTGRNLRKVQEASPNGFPRERILELFHSGMEKPSDIMHALAAEGLHAWRESISRMLVREGLREKQPRAARKKASAA